MFSMEFLADNSRAKRMYKELLSGNERKLNCLISSLQNVTNCRFIKCYRFYLPRITMTGTTPQYFISGIAITHSKQKVEFSSFY